MWSAARICWLQFGLSLSDFLGHLRKGRNSRLIGQQCGTSKNSQQNVVIEHHAHPLFLLYPQEMGEIWFSPVADILQKIPHIELNKVAMAQKTCGDNIDLGQNLPLNLNY